MSQFISVFTFCIVLALANGAAVKTSLKLLEDIENRVPGEIGRVSVFYLSTFKATWQGALDYCVLTEGLNLMYTTSRQLNLELTNYVKSKNVSSQRMWISGKEGDSDNGTFFWHYNSQVREFVYTNWAKDEPIMNRNQRDCIDVLTTEESQDGFTWRTTPCERKQYFICVGV